CITRQPLLRPRLCVRQLLPATMTSRCVAYRTCTPTGREGASMQRFPMTTEGAAALRDELQRLKTEDRPRVSKAIAEAREHGDLNENAELHAAREEQGFIEGRIQEIEAKRSAAQFINIRDIPVSGKVIFGTTVTIINTATDEEKTYQIVGDDEADIKKNKISVNSPIARGLIGKEEGDVAKIETPSGMVEYEIDQVQHI